MQVDLKSVDIAALMADTRVQIVGAVLLATYTLAWCRIFAKAGYRSATGLIMLLPGLNFGMLLVFAFSRWPASNELKGLRKMEQTIHKASGKRLKEAA